MTGCSRGPMEKSWGRLLDGGLVCTMPSGTATVSRSRDRMLLAQPARTPPPCCYPHAGASASRQCPAMPCSCGCGNEDSDRGFVSRLGLGLTSGCPASSLSRTS